jgi:hypothetical protein
MMYMMLLGAVAVRSSQLFLGQNQGDAPMDELEKYDNNTYEFYDNSDTFSHPNNDPFITTIKQEARETFLKDVIIPLSPQDDDDIKTYYPIEYDNIIRERSYLNSTTPDKEVHISYDSIDDVDDLRYLWVSDAEMQQQIRENAKKNKERSKIDDGDNQTLNQEEYE